MKKRYKRFILVLLNYAIVNFNWYNLTLIEFPAIKNKSIQCLQLL